MKTSDRGPLRGLLQVVALAVVLALSWVSPSARAQDQAENGPTVVDYADWERTAERAEGELGLRATSDDRLDELRAQLARWRTAFLTAQTANSARIATVKEQIAALGPPPETGTTEAPEIAARRSDLADLLVKLQAPGIAAEEAYRRADGLIREIDRILRERQADELLKVWPSPVNPANWPEAAVGLTDTTVRVWDEVAENSAETRKRTAFVENLPLILGLFAIWLGLMIFARRWIERFADRLQQGGTEARRQFLSTLASVGQVVVPTAGFIALAAALVLTGMLGEISLAIASSLPILGFAVFGAIWLGGRAFPRLQDEAGAILPLAADRRAEGRLVSMLLGAVMAADVLRGVAMDAQQYSEATSAVSMFPILVIGGFGLWRMGRVLGMGRDDGPRSYVQMLLGVLARTVKLIGIAAPLIAATGFVQAARALVFPAIGTLALVTVLFLLQRLVADLWAMIRPGDDADEREGLVPTLAGFGLTLMAMPVLALIWGARWSDLTELWEGFHQGFQMGDARISPTDFIIFAVIFVAGYLLTRVFQGALRNTILPKTRMDRGGQTALVSGTGYMGIFLAALIAINATGIDLSGLAIVAGALSVGIGFGLQNIVSNFVAGIILLIERPVSEGDWIEVGGVQGIVKTISVRSTRVQTFDRTMVIVPNADLVSQQVKNWTRFGLAGRLVVTVVVANGNDTRKVERILRDIAEAQPLVVLNPPPIIVFQGFTADAMTFEMRVILRDVNFSLQVRTDINHMIVERFATEGVVIPFAQSEITLRNAAEVGQALSVLPPAAARPSRTRATVAQDPA